MKYIKKWLEDEVVDTLETEVIEENIYIDESLLKNKSLIRVDLNTIQYPLFSKNKKRKENQIIKYFFNQKRDTYINVVPASGDYIPGELEEKIFLALMKIMKKRNMQKKFIVTASELKSELNMNTKDYVKRVKESLVRLATTNYQFKNTLYSNKEKSLLTKEIHTTIMSLQILKLEEKKNKKLKDQIGDKRIKEVYEITISDHFYDNLVSKGYLVYDSDILLQIENSIARTLYLLIEKLRFNELELKVDIIFLMKRIPLKYDKKNISRTVQVIKKSLEELESLNLVKEFIFIKETTWENSEVKIIFPEESLYLKQDRFYGDLNDFKKMATTLSISEMEHDSIDDNSYNFNITEEEINNILNKLPLSARKLKSMPKAIKESIETYGLHQVMATVEYIKKQKKVEKPRAYFLRALEEKWYDLEVLDKIKNEKIMKKKKVEEVIIPEKEEKSLYSNFESFSKDIQKEIENETYKEYIELCGTEGKIQKLAYEKSRKKLISDYLKKNNKYFSTSENVRKSETKENIFDNIESLKKDINKYVAFYQEIIGAENLNFETITKKIVLDCMMLFFKKELTEKKLEEIIKINLMN